MQSTAGDFVPADLDASRWENISPLVESLLQRPVSDPAQMERWLADRSEFDAACAEAAAILYITMTCSTEDENAQRAYLTFVEEVQPELKKASFRLDRRQVELARETGLSQADTDSRYAVLMRDTEADVSVFRDENVPLFTEADRLENEYQRVIGKMTVVFRGQERTLPQMGAFLEKTDRATREEAWRLVASRRLEDRDSIENIFDKLVSIRHRAAVNAGFDNYLDYTFVTRHRFDYTPAACRDFHLACEKIVVPFNRSLDARRRERLGVDRLRPWDMGVDPLGREPLRPFENGAELVARSRAAFDRLDPELAEMFRALGDGSNTQGPAHGESLDLDSRRGKAPGGYQYMRDRSRKPFIFMNASGLHRDVETMVHEAGHAFHSMLSKDEPLVHYRHAPIEFCEVASMAMELLTMPHWGGDSSFYPDPADLARAQRKQIEGSISLLPWIATVDAFQHWVYLNPSHSREDRANAWLELDARFGHDVSWQGLDHERAYLWHRQPHPFTSPLYYIEYGIAQLGSLQLWLRSLEDGPQAALEAYKRALALGGSRPLPELFAAADIEFDFGPDAVARIVDRAQHELARLPE